MKAASTKLYADVVKAPIGKTQDWMQRKKEQILNAQLPNIGPIPLGPTMNMTVREGIDAAKDSFDKIVGKNDGGGERTKGTGDTGGKYSDAEIKNIVDELQSYGFKNHSLRQAYENEVADLAKMGEELLKQGKSIEEVSRTLHQVRRDLGVKYKDATPQPLRDYIYELNQGRYKDPLGPKYEDLLENGKTYEQIIASTSRPNDDINKLLSGFEEWLRR